jgi:predicted RNase H-like HicB family nuclease
MGTVVLSPYVVPSSTGQYSYIPLASAASSPITPTLAVIEGPLPEGRWLTPILVKIVEEDREEGEEREFVVTETKYYMHAAGKTVSEAIEAFKRILSQYLDGLTEREERLSPWMHERLEYLRSVIRIS